MNLSSTYQDSALKVPPTTVFYYWSLYLLAFSIPFPYLTSAISIVLVLLCWLSTGLAQNMRAFLSRPLLWGWILFFVLHCISFFYSSNKSESIFDIESKLSFLILPLIIGTGPRLNNKEIRNILISFVLGVTIVGIAAFSYSTYCYFYKEGGLSNFFYNNMVRVTEANAVFVAWYTITAIFILLSFSYSFLKLPPWLYTLFIIFLQIFFLSLSARLLIMIESILILPLSWLAYRKNHGEKIGLVLASAFMGVILLVVVTKNPISNRYKIIAPSHTNNWLIDEHDDSATQDFTNVTLRLFIWKTSIESILENKYYYYGCGNGDVGENQKKSIARYNKNLSEGNRNVELWKYNIHNMYLQVLYMLGIPGLLLFLYNIISMLKTRYKGPFRIFARIFIVTGILFMCIEAALQTQAGIVFFTFFGMLLLKIHYAEKELPH